MNVNANLIQLREKLTDMVDRIDKGEFDESFEEHFGTNGKLCSFKMTVQDIPFEPVIQFSPCPDDLDEVIDQYNHMGPIERGLYTSNLDL